MEATVITYIIAFFVIDFYGYWTHRWAHQINFFWNKHAIHHSSEEFNLACALRQTVSSFVNLFTFLLIPLKPRSYNFYIKNLYGLIFSPLPLVFLLQ